MRWTENERRAGDQHGACGARGWTARHLVRLAVAALALGAAVPPVAHATERILSRHADTTREQATKYPRSEGDQALVDGWPLYRTERGQEAFNAAMATLRASEARAPAASAFKGCTALKCELKLPPVDEAGWLPPGRLWVSPGEYVLIAHSPRAGRRSGYRRHSARSMRYFVFHEFHNSSRNTDLFDTISSHSGSVFVPFYLGKTRKDAAGRSFVVVLQVAPYDVISVHATNYDSAGPGIEVALNSDDDLEPLQGLAGTLVATMVKSVAPHLRVVNHRGSEGLAMLEGYQERLASLRGRQGPAVVLPYYPAPAERIAAASGLLGDMLAGHARSRPVPMAARSIVPQRPKVEVAAASAGTQAAAGAPQLVGPVRLVTRPAPAGAPSLVGPVRLLRDSRAGGAVASGN